MEVFKERAALAYKRTDILHREGDRYTDKVTDMKEFGKFWVFCLCMHAPGSAQDRVKICLWKTSSIPISISSVANGNSMNNLAHLKISCSWVMTLSLTDFFTGYCMLTNWYSDTRLDCLQMMGWFLWEPDILSNFEAVKNICQDGSEPVAISWGLHVYVQSCSHTSHSKHSVP